jgi:PAS domain S-box-containing protein
MDQEPAISQTAIRIGSSVFPKAAIACLAMSVIIFLLFLTSRHQVFPTYSFLELLLLFTAGIFMFLAGLQTGRRRASPPPAKDEFPGENAVTIDRDWARTFDAVPDLMAILGSDHRIRKVNQAMAARFAMTPGDMIGRQCFSFMHRTDHPIEACPLKKALVDGQSHSEEIYEPELDSYFLVNVVPILDAHGKIDGAVHIARDITGSKRAAQSLMESEERYRILFEQADVLLFLFHLDRNGEPGPFSEVNEAACRALGYSPEEMRSLSLRDLCEKGENSTTGTLLNNFSRRGARPVTLMLVAKNSMRILVEASARLFDLAGRPTVLAAARDITEHKVMELELRRYRDQLENLVQEKTAALVEINEALRSEVRERTEVEKTLRQSEHHLRQLLEEFNGLLEAIPDTLVLLSPDLHVLWTNKAPNGGVHPDRLPSSDHACYQLWGDHAGHCADCPARRSFSTARPDTSQISTADGRTWEVRAFPIKDAQGRAVKMIETVTEITEKITLQAEAVRAAHLASLGELAAGVAHEINNPINGIINYAQMIANRIEKESREFDIAGRIIKEGDRIAVIVRSLLSFARAKQEEKKPTHVREILLDTLTLTEAQLRRDFIHLETKFPRQPLIIFANGSQIEQVFLNLINNARYALNQKYPDPHENKRLAISGAVIDLAGREYIRLIFHDHGTGIAAAIRDKVMNPFFSDKPGEKGTGLGLSISHGIVTDHEGRISIDTVEGEYTNFIIDLPSAGEATK